MPINSNRVRLIKEGQARRGPVVYWMSREQRVDDNWALLFAQELAMKRKVPLGVVFCLVPTFLSATIRQYGFMLKGLQEVEKRLARLKIPFFLLLGFPDRQIPLFLSECGFGALVTDFDPLRVKLEWKKAVAEQMDGPIYEVDGRNIVPCWVTSTKREYAAYTLRPKIHRLLPEFLEEFPSIELHPFSWHCAPTTLP